MYPFSGLWYLVPVSLALLSGSIYAQFCPQMLTEESACTCFNYIDGAVIECEGPEGPEVVEKLKTFNLEIRELAIRNADIIEIGPRAFRNLRIKKLILDHNRIRSLHADAFRGLEYSMLHLSLTHNKLTEIPTDSLANMKNLLTLDLQCNNIGNIYNTAFRNNSNLMELNLACNQICRISPDAFEGIKLRLQSLILDQNCLQEVPAKALRGFNSLLGVHLQDNRIPNLDKLQFMNLLSLVMIRLSGNQIRSIHPQAFTNIPNLRYLYLDRNKLNTILPNTLQQFRFLEIADLAYNNIAEIVSGTFGNMEHLMQLNLEGNMITDIQPGAFSGSPLLVLLLGQNCLNSVSQQTFTGIPFLRQLSLTSNNLRAVQAFAFAQMPNLQILDLSRNKIETVPTTAFTYSQTTTILLQENPLVCTQGYHLIQGGQGIHLLNQEDMVCKAELNTREETCPTRKQIPTPAPCCAAPKPIVSSRPELPDLSRFIRTTTPTSISTRNRSPTNEEQSGTKEDDEEENEEGSEEKSGESSQVGRLKFSTTNSRTIPTKTPGTSEGTTARIASRINWDRFRKLQNTDSSRFAKTASADGDDEDKKSETRTIEIAANEDETPISIAAARNPDSRGTTIQQPPPNAGIGPQVRPQLFPNNQAGRPLPGQLPPNIILQPGQQFRPNIFGTGIPPPPRPQQRFGPDGIPLSGLLPPDNAQFQLQPRINQPIDPEVLSRVPPNIDIRRRPINPNQFNPNNQPRQFPPNFNPNGQQPPNIRFNPNGAAWPNNQGSPQVPNPEGFPPRQIPNNAQFRPNVPNGQQQLNPNQQPPQQPQQRPPVQNPNLQLSQAQQQQQQQRQQQQQQQQQQLQQQQLQQQQLQQRQLQQQQLQQQQLQRQQQQRQQQINQQRQQQLNQRIPQQPQTGQQNLPENRPGNPQPNRPPQQPQPSNSVSPQNRQQPDPSQLDRQEPNVNPSQLNRQPPNPQFRPIEAQFQRPDQRPPIPQQPQQPQPNGNPNTDVNNVPPQKPPQGSPQPQDNRQGGPNANPNQGSPVKPQIEFSSDSRPQVAPAPQNVNRPPNQAAP